MTREGDELVCNKKVSDDAKVVGFLLSLFVPFLLSIGNKMRTIEKLLQRV